MKRSVRKEPFGRNTCCRREQKFFNRLAESSEFFFIRLIKLLHSVFWIKNKWVYYLQRCCEISFIFIWIAKIKKIIDTRLIAFCFIVLSFNRLCSYFIKRFFFLSFFDKWKLFKLRINNCSGNKFIIFNQIILFKIKLHIVSYHRFVQLFFKILDKTRIRGWNFQL